MGEIAKLCSMHVILLLCEFVGLFLITSSCESMTDLSLGSISSTKNNALYK